MLALRGQNKQHLYNQHDYVQFFQVSSTGLLSFRQSFTHSMSILFPLEAKILIAPFWSDVDTSFAGLVSYRFSMDQSLLDAVQVYINESLNAPFSPAFLFIATWDRVPQLRGDLSVVCT